MTFTEFVLEQRRPSAPRLLSSPNGRQQQDRYGRLQRRVRRPVVHQPDVPRTFWRDTLRMAGWSACRLPDDPRSSNLIHRRPVQLAGAATEHERHRTGKSNAVSRQTIRLSSEFKTAPRQIVFLRLVSEACPLPAFHLRNRPSDVRSNRPGRQGHPAGRSTQWRPDMDTPVITVEMPARKAPPIPRNGVDTPKLFATIGAVVSQPALAQFRFRAQSHWVGDTAHDDRRLLRRRRRDAARGAVRGLR